MLLNKDMSSKIDRSSFRGHRRFDELGKNASSIGFGRIQGEGISEILDVVFALKFWNTSGQHHCKQVDEQFGVGANEIESRACLFNK